MNFIQPQGRSTSKKSKNPDVQDEPQDSQRQTQSQEPSKIYSRTLAFVTLEDQRRFEDQVKSTHETIPLELGVFKYVWRNQITQLTYAKLFKDFQNTVFDIRDASIYKAALDRIGGNFQIGGQNGRVYATAGELFASLPEVVKEFHAEPEKVPEDEEKERKLLEAKAKAERIFAKAKAESDRLFAEARAEAERVLSEARTEVERVVERNQHAEDENEKTTRPEEKENLLTRIEEEEQQEKITRPEERKEDLPGMIQEENLDEPVSGRRYHVDSKRKQRPPANAQPEREFTRSSLPLLRAIFPHKTEAELDDMITHTP